VPFINKPVNGEWVDGGVRDQIPLAHIQQALDEGFEKIVCIINNPIHTVPEKWKLPKFIPLMGILIRVADSILSCETWLDELRVLQELQKQGLPIEVYMPTNYWMDTQDYVPEKIRQGIAMGYAAKPTDLTKVSL
jgi:predicted patatin/cPLA2 family phospholipase